MKEKGEKNMGSLGGMEVRRKMQKSEISISNLFLARAKWGRENGETLMQREV